MKKSKKIKVTLPRSYNYQVKRKKYLKLKTTKSTNLWQDYKSLVLNWKIDPLAMIASCIISKDLLTLVKFYLLFMTCSYLIIAITDIVRRKK